MNALLTLFLFGSPDPPPWYWDHFPDRVKAGIVYRAGLEGLTHPAAETPSFEYFRGTVYVWRRRYAGKPLPWPADPIFGR